MIYLRFALCLVLVFLLVACQDTPRERSQKVGRVERSYVDEQRLNWRGDGPRPMLSVIWFPTDSAAEVAALRAEMAEALGRESRGMRGCHANSGCCKGNSACGVVAGVPGEPVVP